MDTLYLLSSWISMGKKVSAFLMGAVLGPGNCLVTWGYSPSLVPQSLRAAPTPLGGLTPVGLELAISRGPRGKSGQAHQEDSELGSGAFL